MIWNGSKEETNLSNLVIQYHPFQFTIGIFWGKQELYGLGINWMGKDLYIFLIKQIYIKL